MYPNISLDSIIIEKRLRTEYGDLSDLDNIADVGLIEPIILQLVQITAPGHLLQQGYKLVAGGRRLTKLGLLGFKELEHGVTSTPGKAGYLFREELDEDVAKEIELYENIARKQMTWKERILSIYEIHLIKLKRQVDKSPDVDWTIEMTGKELGMKKANTEHMLRVARDLLNPKSPLHEAVNFTDALKMQLKLKEDEARRRGLELAKKSSLIIMPDEGQMDKVAQGAVVLREPPREVSLSSLFFNGKMEEVLADFPAESIDGIYTDWPYAIDMTNIQQANMGMNVQATAAEHDKLSNLQSFHLWLAAMHRVLKPSSFCITWCDLEHWGLMATLAENIGFRVQRWPMHWVKTHPCQNGAAQYNQTKAVEHAMVLRMPGATLAKQIPNNYWIGTFEKGEKFQANHPFAKPRALHARVLGDFFSPGMSILDPFAGGGSIPLACISNGFQPLAIEMVKNHFDNMEVAVRELYTKLTINNVKFT